MITSEREELISYIWDAYKDAHGIRPRWVNFADYNDEDLERWADRLEQEVAWEMDSQRLREQNALVKFEDKVAEMISLGAKDREAAIRWLVDSVEGDNSQGDPEYVAYLFGLDYDHANTTTLSCSRVASSRAGRIGAVFGLSGSG